MATHAAVPDQTRDSLLWRRSVSAHEERAWGRGVAGFRFAWLARLEPFWGKESDSPGSNLACIKYA